MSSLAGSFLVARNSLRDAFFGRTVVLLIHHGAEGAFGLVLNRPAKTDELPFPVYIGGPCPLQGLLMLHGQKDWLSDQDDSPGELCPGVFLGDEQSFDRLGEVAQKEGGRYRVFTGYSGWGPEQLEGEMAEGAWIVLAANGERLFDTPPEELWERLAPPTLREPSMN